MSILSFQSFPDKDHKYCTITKYCKTLKGGRGFLLETGHPDDFLLHSHKPQISKGNTRVVFWEQQSKWNPYLSVFLPAVASFSSFIFSKPMAYKTVTGLHSRYLSLHWVKIQYDNGELHRETAQKGHAMIPIDGIVLTAPGTSVMFCQVNFCQKKYRLDVLTSKTKEEWYRRLKNKKNNWNSPKINAPCSAIKW